MISQHEVEQQLGTMLGISNLPKAKQMEIFDELGKVVFKRVLLKVLSLMPGEKLDEFERLMKEEKEQELQELIKAHVPNVDEVINAEVRATIETHQRRVVQLLEQQQNAGGAQSNG